MTTWDPFGTSNNESTPLEGWAAFESTDFQPVANALESLQVEDFFADMTWPSTTSLKGLGTEPPPSPQKLSEDLMLELEFTENPSQTFHNYFENPVRQQMKNAVLVNLSKSRRFLELFVQNIETFQIEDEVEFKMLYHSIINQFGMRSKEAITLYIYGAKTFQKSSMYAEALLLSDPEKFLEIAKDLDLQPTPSLIKQIAKQGILYHLTFTLSCDRNPKWLENSPSEALIPFLEEMPIPFSWTLFAETIRHFAKEERERFFEAVEPLVPLETAAEVFSILDLENSIFAKKVFLKDAELFGKIFQKQLSFLAKEWIDSREIFQGFPFAIIEDEKERAEIAHQLALRNPYGMLGALPFFKPKNEELFMPTFRYLAAEEPAEFVLIMEKLHIRSRKNLEELSNLLLQKTEGLSVEAKENFSLFLREFLSLRIGEKKEEFLKYLFQRAKTEDLEMLFTNLPVTQKKTKCVNAFVPAVFGRFVRGKQDLEWEKKLAGNNRLLRDNVHAEAVFVWIHQIQELKETFPLEDIELILNQLFCGEESLPKRIDLTRSLLELNAAELLTTSQTLPIATLENILKIRAQELFDLSPEQSAALLEKFLKWRSPFAIFKFLIKIDTLDAPKRVVAREAVREFLLAYLNDTYETWRYERSPHLSAMRDQGIFEPRLEEWWKSKPVPEDLDPQHTIEISSDPVDFFLCGDECGGCQRLSNKVEHVLPLLGLMDGMFKMVIVRNKQTGKMITRSFVRWLTDKEGQKPVLLLEPPYTLHYNSAHAGAMLNYLKKHASTAPIEFPIVISPHFIKTYQSEAAPFPRPLYAEGSFAPMVFSDTVGFEISKGEGGIKTNGNYVIQQAAAVTYLS